MDQQSTGRRKTTVLIAGTVAAVLLWGFGIEYLLHAYVFISPPKILSTRPGEPGKLSFVEQ
jgi:hypothetical protein